MHILSIDASTKSTGWAVYNTEDQKLIDYGLITSSSSSLVKRVEIMVNNLYEKFKEYKIQHIVLEEVLPEKDFNNLKTHKALMYLQAALFLKIGKECDYDISLFTFLYPSHWRKKCGIDMGKCKRKELKEKDVEFVNSHFKEQLTKDILINDDIADAIGIGWGYLKDIEEELNWE